MSDVPTSHREYWAGSAPVPLVPFAAVDGSLIGREDEIARILDLLDHDHVRIVSLLGPGGVGKTRLAQEVMRRSQGDYAHGARYVALAEIRDAALVPGAVVRSLGVEEQGTTPIEEQLASWLGPRHFLLVLDNMEQVISAAFPWLADLLTACPRLTVLITSRVPLAISGERRFRVLPLPVPVAGPVSGPNAAASVALFVERGKEVRHDFAIDEGNADAVAAICRHLDGLPLAIELAAARLNTFTPAEILARLGNSMGILVGTRRDVPARLRSMHSAIGWSYDLLSPDQQDLVRRLSVFVGGFTLQAAESVASSSIDVADVLGDLVDHSLVERLEIHGQSRFRMLETIREFGIERLAERGEIAGARDAHAGYYLRLGPVARQGLLGCDLAKWLDLLEADVGNIFQALDWLMTHGREDGAVELVWQFEPFLNIRAHFAGTRRFLDAWFIRPASTQRTRARGIALLARSILWMEVESPELSIPQLEEALSIFREAGDRSQAMWTLGVLAMIHAREGDLNQARDTHREYAALVAQLRDARAETVAMEIEAVIATHYGAWSRARILREAYLARARELGLQRRETIALVNLAEHAMVKEGDPGRAQTLLAECLEIQERLGERRNLALTHVSLADAFRATGDLDQAIDHLDTAVSLARDTGIATHEGSAHLGLARIALLRHDMPRAMRELRLACAMQWQAGNVGDLSEAINAISDLALQSGDAESAARFLGASANIGGLEKLTHQPMHVPGADAYHDRLVEQARATLGDAVFHNLVAEGATWSLDETVRASLGYEHMLAKRVAPKKHASPHGLSPREIDVLRLLANGLSNQEIADELYVSLRTVTTHITRILGKLGLSSRTAAVAFAIRNDIA